MGMFVCDHSDKVPVAAGVGPSRMWQQTVGAPGPSRGGEGVAQRPCADQEDKSGLCSALLEGSLFM